MEAHTVCAPQVGPVGQQLSLCWRPFSIGTAPMLAAACGPSVQIWQHDLAHLRWKVSAERKAHFSELDPTWVT